MFVRQLQSFLVIGVLAASLSAGEYTVRVRGSADKGEKREATPRIELKRVTEVLASKVQSQRGEELGRLEDVVIDVWPGKLAYLVLAKDDKMHAIPFTLVHTSEKDPGVFVAAIDRDRLQGAETIEPGRWPDMADSRWARSLHSYFSAQPYWEAGGVSLQGEPISNEKRSPDQDRVLVRATNLLNAPVQSESGKRIGEISDLLIDTINQRYSFAVIKFDEKVRLGREKTEGRVAPIPWCKCAFGLSSPSNPVVILNKDLKQLRGRTVAEDELGFVATENWAENMYRIYGQDPYWLKTSSRR